LKLLKDSEKHDKEEKGQGESKGADDPSAAQPQGEWEKKRLGCCRCC